MMKTRYEFLSDDTNEQEKSNEINQRKLQQNLFWYLGYYTDMGWLGSIRINI